MTGWRKRRVATQQQKDNMAHGQWMLEMGEARTLLHTWQRNQNNEWLRDALGKTEKTYGPGAPDRIRKYMRVIHDEDLKPVD